MGVKISTKGKTVGGKGGGKPLKALLSPAAPPGSPQPNQPFASWLPVTTIHPYFQNPRVNAESVARVAASIREFGFRQPIVVDEDMTIIVGHTRRLAAIKLGMDKVPVHVAHGLDPTKARAYRLADNKAGESSTWDEDLLRVEGLEIMQGGIDLTPFGFLTTDFEEHISRLPTESHLEDFNVVAKPKPQWILISCSYERAAEIMEMVTQMPGVTAHTTSQTNSKLALKNLGKKKHVG